MIILVNSYFAGYLVFNFRIIRLEIVLYVPV
jgi:hypothetical protein